MVVIELSSSYLCLWILFSIHTISSKGDQQTLELGSTLTPISQPLHSPSSDFLLSFRPPPAAFTTADASSPSSASSSTALFLAISFGFAQTGPPAWVGNRDTAVSSSATLTLLSNGDLSLSDPVVSPSPIWSSQTPNLGVVRAQLLDSGNLVLLNNNSAYVWQSFLYPTDTLLPTQIFTNKSSLWSSERAGLFKTGSYFLNFSGTGVFQLSSSSQPRYWAPWESMPSFWFDISGSNVTLHSSPSSIIKIFMLDVKASSSSYRITLDIDGNLRMYVWDVASLKWKSIWMAFVNVCSRVRGLCGDYGICVYTPQPTCVCPQGFSVKDPTLLSSGCDRKYPIEPNCSTSIKYAELENVNYPFNDYGSRTKMSRDDCKEWCSQVCACVAVVFTVQIDDYGHCWLKNASISGRYVATQRNKVFLKVSASDPSPFSPIEDTAATWSSQTFLHQPSSANQSISANYHTGYKATLVIALSVLVGVQAVCFAAVCGALFRSRRKLRYRRLCRGMKAVLGSPIAFSYQEIEVATENFCHKLGSGGFGTVYKGKLQDGILVAVKQLEGVSQQEEQFKAEIATLGRIHHIHLLRLVGFCSEGTHRLLVYEFMENGSLDQILFHDGSNAAQVSVLDWGTRFQICLGVARGIHYLHEGCLDCILHCDIKPQNILLDGSFAAKVADFGLAYLYSRDRTVKLTTIRGTRGYLAPEWVLNLPITTKADVYSYGMLVMEIVSGRKNYLYTESAVMDTDDRWYFPVWAYGKVVDEVIDSRMDAASIYKEQAESVLKVAFACIQGDMKARPSMGRVVQMLEGTVPIPETPPPSCFPHGHVTLNHHTLSSSTVPASSTIDKSSDNPSTTEPLTPLP